MCCVMQAIEETSYFGMSFYERMDFYKVPALSVCTVEDGKIDLDGDIRQYTDADFYNTFDCQKHRVTLRNLLSHTAGFNIGGFTGYLYTMDIPSIDQE